MQVLITHTGRVSWTTLFSLFWFLLCLTVCLFSVFSVFGCQFGEIKLCVCLDVCRTLTSCHQTSFNQKNHTILSSVKLPQRLGCVEEHRDSWAPPVGSGAETRPKNDFSVFQVSNKASRWDVYRKLSSCQKTFINGKTCIWSSRGRGAIAPSSLGSATALALGLTFLIALCRSNKPEIPCPDTFTGDVKYLGL